MKISEAMKHKGRPFWIPDCTRSELPAFFKEIGFKRGVEIGVAWAQNIIDYCEAGLEMYGIDPWHETEDFKYRKIISVEGKYGKTIEGIYQLAKDRTAKYPNCKLIAKTSMEALADFKDRSLDFVYIDGDHSFGYVAMDIWKWSRKVRKGGVIAGHDYHSTIGMRSIRQVRQVVDAFINTSEVENWWGVGRPDAKEGEKRDRELSFFFFKHW